MECSNEYKACDVLVLVQSKLSEILGTYTHDNGFTEPSICIGNTPDTLTVDGLEVVIDFLPQQVRRYQTTNGFVDKLLWSIHLFDYTNGSALRQALYLLNITFPESRYIYYPPQSDLKSYNALFSFYLYQSNQV